MEPHPPEPLTSGLPPSDPLQPAGTDRLWLRCLKRLGALLVKGLSAILPVSIVLFFIFWIGSGAENLMGPLLKRLLPPDYYVPGMGVLAGLLLAIGVGLLLNVWLVQRLFVLIESWISRIPLVKTILAGIRDMMRFLAKNSQMRGHRFVVQVDLGNNTSMLGIKTRRDLRGSGLSSLGPEQACAVYLPMSYMIGGYALLVPRSAIRPLDMSMDDAMRFILTAGVTGASQTVAAQQPKPDDSQPQPPAAQ